MRGLRVLIVLAVVLVVSLVAGAYAAAQDEPSLTAADAVTFTRQALAESGVKNFEVVGEVRAEPFKPEGSDTIPVWVVPATVSGRPIELYVAQSGDRAVNLDDALPDGGYVLTEEQFKALERFRFDPAAERVQDRRRGPAVAAGILAVVVAVALLLSVVSTRARTAEAPDGR